MAAAHKFETGYWKPPAPLTEYPIRGQDPELCRECQAELPLLPESHYCHICGTARDSETESAETRAQNIVEFRMLRKSLELTAGSLVAFVVGIFCVCAAGATGVIYTASSLTDWQALQFWRIQWLLAAVAAFLAGILLKRTA